MENKKTFKELKSGDTVYKVVIHEYKTKIIPKIVREIRPGNTVDTIRLYTKCIDSKFDSNFFPHILINSSIHKCAYSPNQYICTNVEDAKIVCERLANEMVSKAEKEISKLSLRLNRWRLHQEELRGGNYIIK